MAEDVIVIVGGGLASARAIKAYREAGGDAAIRLFSADASLPYHRPPLSKRFMRGEAEPTDTLVETEAFYRDHGVDVRLDTRATALSLRDRGVTFADGGRETFGRLLIATGTSPRKLDAPGADLDGIFALRTLGDAERIRNAARAARRAVVIGAGFIGMEIAASLTQLGVGVTLLHRGNDLFATLRAPQLASFLAKLYADKGVDVVFGDEVASFGGHGALATVTTRGGRSYPADLAVVGIGVRPNTDWLDGSGLTVDDGVVVDVAYRTNAEGVYAAGDVARFYDPLFEKHRRIEHWSNANFQGTQVGRVLAGDDVSYDTVSTFFSEVFGVSVKVFGDLDTFDDRVVRGSFDDGDAIAFYLERRRLVACLLVGQDEETETRLKELLARRARLTDAAALDGTTTQIDEAFDAAAAP